MCIIRRLYLLLVLGMSIETTKNVNQIDNKDNSYLGYLNYKRNEVQRIIDNHLKKDDNRWFSVMNRTNEQLDVLIWILTWDVTWEDLDKAVKKSEDDMKKVYLELKDEYEKFLSQRTKDNLNSLKDAIFTSDSINLSSTLDSLNKS